MYPAKGSYPVDTWKIQLSEKKEKSYLDKIGMFIKIFFENAEVLRRNFPFIKNVFSEENRIYRYFSFVQIYENTLSLVCPILRNIKNQSDEYRSSSEKLNPKQEDFSDDDLYSSIKSSCETQGDFLKYALSEAISEEH